jgi:hypothetical protein
VAQGCCKAGLVQGSPRSHVCWPHARNNYDEYEYLPFLGGSEHVHGVQTSYLVNQKFRRDRGPGDWATTVHPRPRLSRLEDASKLGATG